MPVVATIMALAALRKTKEGFIKRVNWLSLEVTWRPLATL
jgi:hypothetical protein